MKWRRVSATASVALGTLLVPWFICACNSPTLPVPPPADPLNVPSALLVDSEHVSLSGTQAWPGALVIAVNQTLLESNPEEAIRGTRVDANGRYAAVIRVDLRCTRTNIVDIWQRNDDGFESKPRRFEAPTEFGDAAPPSGGCNDAGPPNGADVGAGPGDDGGTAVGDGGGE